MVERGERVCVVASELVNAERDVRCEPDSTLTLLASNSHRSLEINSTHNNTTSWSQRRHQRLQDWKQIKLTHAFVCPQAFADSNAFRFNHGKVMNDVDTFNLISTLATGDVRGPSNAKCRE